MARLAWKGPIMPKFKPQFRRLLFIDRAIKAGTFPNCARLAAEWEVSDKTIQRDIDYLRDQLEAPLAYNRLKRGYYYTEPTFALPAINLNESDLFAVCVAQTVLNQYRHTPLFQKLASVFAKIHAALPDKTPVKPAWMDERILVFPEPATRVDCEVWDTLAKALRENRRLRIVHAGPGGGEADAGPRTVDPYYLVSYKGEWYLSSFCHRRQAIRTFAISRIRRAAVLEEGFTLPAGMTHQRMFGDPFGIIWKEAFHQVRIRFSPEVAPYIRERQWHPRQTIRDLRGGGAVLEFTTNHLNEVKDWALSWGPGATVLAPRALVDKVRKALRQAAANYR